MKDNPIIIIDDDSDDLEMFKEACKDLGVKNEVIAFSEGLEFLNYIRQKDIKCFFIICDISMAKINGLELKRLIHSDKDLALRCIPFLLWSTSSASHLVAAAYSCNVQGYFVKPGAYSELKEMVHSLINYWSLSEHPNAA